jgi:hypothetical protein
VLGARQPLANGFRPRLSRHADLVEACRDFRVADDERLDLRDSAALDSEARDEHGRLAAFADGAHEHGLTALDVGELQRVAAAAGRGVPEAVAERKALAR